MMSLNAAEESLTVGRTRRIRPAVAPPTTRLSFDLARPPFANRANPPALKNRLCIPRVYASHAPSPCDWYLLTAIRAFVSGSRALPGNGLPRICHRPVAPDG